METLSSTIHEAFWQAMAAFISESIINLTELVMISMMKAAMEWRNVYDQSLLIVGYHFHCCRRIFLATHAFMIMLSRCSYFVRGSIHLLLYTLLYSSHHADWSKR